MVAPLPILGHFFGAAFLWRVSGEYDWGQKKKEKKSKTLEETIMMLKANQIAGTTNDFKMDTINKRVPRQP